MPTPERRAVRRTYDRIAAHFSKTREHPWPEVREFCEGRQADTALDVGCGNGRHAEVLAGYARQVLALDASRELLCVARDRADERDFDVTLLQGDATSLPLADGCVDLALYVATLHHVPSQRLRVASLDELARVLDVGAPALVSTWSTTHDRFEAAAGFDTTIDWTLPDGETVERFYHIYDPAEFDRDLADSALRVEESYLSSGNCYAVVRGPHREGKRP